MSTKLRLVVCCLFAIVLCWAGIDRFTANGQEQKGSAAAPIATPTPDDGFGNVQVLQGVRDLLPTMHFIRASLGVRCDYCHVTETGKYRLDDKPAKIRAREHIIMTRQINEAAYGGRQVVTCNTCHHGSPNPVDIPQIANDVVNTTRREPFEPVLPALPSASEILANYETATHASNLGPARLRLEVFRAKIINSGTPSARVLPRADKTLTDALVDGDRGATTTRLSNGQTARVGGVGARLWLAGESGVQWITTGDLAQTKRKINPLLVLRVRQSDFSSITVSGEEKLSGVDVYVLTAITNDGSSETLWFSKRDGLLVRRTFYHKTLLGLEPEQYDLSGYKRVGGVRLPTVINTSYLDDQHLGVLKRLIDIKLGVPITDKDFEPPER